MKRTAVALATSVLMAAAISAAVGSPVAAQQAPASPEPRLTIGSLFPRTGVLSFLEPPMRAGFAAAIRDVNAAGGVLGRPVRSIGADSGNTGSPRLDSSMRRLMDDGAQVIIGPASSNAVMQVIDDAIDRGRLVFSPTATSDSLSERGTTQGHFVRTVLPDRVEGSALANLALGDSAYARVAILAAHDPYTEAIADALAAELERQAGEAGRAIRATRVAYEWGTTDFSGQVAELKAGKPQAVFIVGWEESQQAVAELMAQGLRPGTGAGRIRVYLPSSAGMDDYWRRLPADVRAGIRWTYPGTIADGRLRDKMRAVMPGLRDFANGAETYDAVILTALAAQEAGSTKAMDIKAALPDVTRTGNEVCRSYRACRALQDRGIPIRYAGPSGIADYRASGDPGVGSMHSWSIDGSGRFQSGPVVKVPLPR